MKKVRRILIIVLCLLVTLSFCVGCGQSSTPLMDQAGKDMTSYLTDGAVKDSDVVMTVNGEDVTADAYMYWVANYFIQLTNYLGEFTLDEDFNGQTIGEYVQQTAGANAAYYENIWQQANSRNIVLSEDQQNELQTYVDELTEQILLTNCTNKEYQEKLYTISLYCDTLEEQLFGVGGEYELTEEDEGVPKL